MAQSSPSSKVRRFPEPATPAVEAAPPAAEAPVSAPEAANDHAPATAKLSTFPSSVGVFNLGRPGNSPLGWAHARYFSWSLRLAPFRPSGPRAGPDPL